MDWTSSTPYLLTPLAKRYVLSLILTAMTALIAYQYSDAPYAQWLVVTALCLALVPLQIAQHYRLYAVALPGLLLALLVCGATLLAHHPLMMGGYLVGVTLVGVYWAERYPAYARGALLICVLLVFAAYEFPLGSLPNRPFYILIGTLIALCWRAVLYVHVLPCMIHSQLKLVLFRTQRLTSDIFACLLEPEYSDTLYLYERRIHVSKDLVLQSMVQLRDLQRQQQLGAVQQDRLQAQIDKLDEVISRIFACAQLRYRVTDPSVFAVCQPELSRITLSLQQLYTQLMQRVTSPGDALNATALDAAVAQLDESYQNVLQVSAPEPLVFLLFMTDLRTLGIALEQLYALL